MGQGCEDLFALRQFRLMETTATRFLVETRSIQEEFSLSHRIVLGTTDTLGARMGQLYQEWFSQRRSTEHMMKGTWNERVVIYTLYSYEWVHSVFSCGMLANKDCVCSACSSDGIAILRYLDDTFKWGEVTKVTFGGTIGL